MSEISAEEKKRILRERRLAKMAKGQATNRLNDILSQGSSIKADAVVSVLDKPTIEQPTPVATGVATGVAPGVVAGVESAINHDDDPDIIDIATVDTPPIDRTENIDEIFNKVFGGQRGSTADQAGAMPGFPGLGDLNDGDGLAKMMAMLNGDPNNDNFEPMNQSPDEMKYQQDLLAYNIYKQKQWKFRFLVVRYFFILINFFYHFINFQEFQSSSSSSIRSLPPKSNMNGFFIFFASVEAVVLSTYYVVSKNQKLVNEGDNHLILKLLSYAAMVMPQVNMYKPLIVQILCYYELFLMFMGDLSLVVVLFGLTSL